MEVRLQRYKVLIRGLRIMILFIGLALIPSVFGGYEFGYYETGSFIVRLFVDSLCLIGLIKLERKCEGVYTFTDESLKNKKEELLPEEESN